MAVRVGMGVLTSVLLLGGCAAPGPVPLPKVAGAQEGWVAGSAAATGPVAADWWKGLGDATLSALVDRALAANADIAEAEAKLRAARASVDAARGRQLPQVNASASATTNEQSGNGMIPFGKLPGVTRNYDLFDAGFDAAWEIDLWGARAKATRAAAARGDAAAAQADGVRLSVVAEVVRSYAELRAGQARRGALAGQAQALEALAALQQARLAAGETARDESLATRQRLEAVRAQQATTAAEIAANAYALGVLSGQPPEAMRALAEAPGPQPAAPAVALLGMRSDVLRRRPDMRAAGADVAAAHADAAVARAQLFPSLSLTGNVGLQARHTGDFTAADSSRFSLGPTLHWPVFAGGQLRAQLRGARASEAAAVARYQKAVLSALADSESAANRLERARAALEAAEAGQSAVAASRRLADLRYARGEDNRPAALEARLAELTAEQTTQTARAAALEAYAALCKALGV